MLPFVASVPIRKGGFGMNGNIGPGNLAHVALADDALAAQHRERLHRVAHAAAPSRSPATCVSTCANTSAGCAPETPYLPSNTKNGTPWMP